MLLSRLVNTHEIKSTPNVTGFAKHWLCFLLFLRGIIDIQIVKTMAAAEFRRKGSIAKQAIANFHDEPVAQPVYDEAVRTPYVVKEQQPLTTPVVGIKDGTEQRYREGLLSSLRSREEPVATPQQITSRANRYKHGRGPRSVTEITIKEKSNV